MTPDENTNVVFLSKSLRWHYPNQVRSKTPGYHLSLLIAISYELKSYESIIRLRTEN